MSRLKENWELCLEAVKYAKEGAARSQNQHYFYSKSPKADRVRHEFLLSCTRSSDFVKTGAGELVTDPVLRQRRELIETLMHGPLTKSQKMKQIDNYIQMWGRAYFWQTAVKGVDVFDGQSSRFKGRELVKHTGYSTSELKSISQEEFAPVVEY